MVRQLLAATSVAAALVFSGSAFGQEPSGKGKQWDELVKAAQREGQVNVIMSAKSGLHKAMPEFEKKYGVKVNYQTGSGRQHAERILAERRMGRYTVDAWMAGPITPLSQLLPNGVLAPIDELLVDPDVKDQSKWYQGRHHYTDPENRYIFTWGASPQHVVSYNTDLVNPAEIKSYWDLLDPKWKGKVVAWSQGLQVSGQDAGLMFLNPKIGEEWFRRWANEMDVTLVDDARQGAEWVALGRFPIGMFGVGTEASKLAQQGFPIKDHLPHSMREGEVLVSGWANIMAIDRAPHPNALKLLVNWVLSREAQQLLIKTGKRYDSLRTDVDNSVIGPQHRVQDDAEHFVAFKSDDYRKRQTEIFDKIRNIMKESGY